MMKFPHVFGVTTELANRFRTLIERLEGDGYAKGDETNRGQIVLVQALAGAFGSAAVERALHESSVRRAFETLREWETEFRLPNDASRSVEQRQARLLAHERINGAAYDDLLRALSTIATVTELHSTTGAIADSEGAEWWTAANTAVELAEESYDDPQVRSQVIELLRRMVPVRNYGQHTLPTPSALVTKTVGARWGSNAHEIDATVLRNEEQSPAVEYPFRPARLVSYGPLTKVRRSDLDAIQRSIFLGDAKGSSVDFQGFGGKRVIVYQAVPGSTTQTADISIDWRDRYIFGVTARNSFDIRPGEASDSFLNGSLGRSFAAISGPGGASYDWDVDGGGAIDFRVSAAGALELVNNTGSTVYVVAMIFASEQLGIDNGGSAGDRSIEWVGFSQPKTFGDVPASYGAALFDVPRWREATENEGGIGTDGLARCGFVVDTADGETYQIDSDIDWRDRLLFIVASVRDNTGADKSVFPGGADDEDFNSDDAGDEAISLGWTGDGTATYQIPLGGIATTQIFLQADGNNGLILDHKGISNFDRASVSVMIYASPQMAIVVGDPADFAPVAAGEVKPSDLNSPQDTGLMAPFAVDDDTETLPLGKVAKGEPRLCYDSRREGVSVHRRPGARPSSLNLGLIDGRERYQLPIVGGVMRFFAEAIGTLTVGTIDSEDIDGGFDWRDRQVHISCVLDTSGNAIYPGGASAASHNGSTAIEKSFYSGPGNLLTGSAIYGVQLATNVRIAVEPDGGLRVANGTGGTIVLSGFVFASPVLGPRYPVG